MADHFQAVHSKLVYTAEKLPTNPPTHQQRGTNPKRLLG